MNLENSFAIDSMAEFLRAIDEKKQVLFKHPLYKSIHSLDDVRIFMNGHVFAVWDFMLLLKTLQRELTNLETFWVPPKYPEAARLINDIVLAEESDEVFPGEVYSHCDLYLKGMKETFADTQTFEYFLRSVEEGVHPLEILEQLEIPPAVKTFVETTISLCGLPEHQVASAFLYGREDVIPEMFLKILDHIERENQAPLKYFKIYLQRHIEMDQDHHGPMLVRVLDILCQGNPQKLQDCYVSAARAIDARILLWDGLLAEIKGARI